MNHKEKINALIPIAEKKANEMVEILGVEGRQSVGVDGRLFQWDYFTEHFHLAMDRLAREKGLRV